MNKLIDSFLKYAKNNPVSYDIKKPGLYYMFNMSYIKKDKLQIWSWVYSRDKDKNLSPIPMLQVEVNTKLADPNGNEIIDPKLNLKIDRDKFGNEFPLMLAKEHYSGYPQENMLYLFKEIKVVDDFKIYVDLVNSLTEKFIKCWKELPLK